MVCRHWVFLRISKHQHLAQESEKQQENLVEGEVVSAVAATPHSEESQQRSGSMLEPQNSDRFTSALLLSPRTLSCGPP